MRAFQTWVGIILLIMLAVMIIFVKVIRDERTFCMKDPLIYGVKSIEEYNGYPFMCECGLLANNSPRVLVTKEGYKPIITDSPNKNISFNFSLLSEAMANA